MKLAKHGIESFFVQTYDVIKDARNKKTILHDVDGSEIPGVLHQFSCSEKHFTTICGFVSHMTGGHRRISELSTVL